MRPPMYQNDQHQRIADLLEGLPVGERVGIKRTLLEAANLGEASLHVVMDQRERADNFARDVHDRLVKAVGDGHPLVREVDDAVRPAPSGGWTAPAISMRAAIDFLRSLSEYGDEESGWAAAEGDIEATQRQAPSPRDARMKPSWTEDGRLYVPVPQSWRAPLASAWHNLVARPAAAAWRVRVPWLPAVAGRIVVLFILPVTVGLFVLYIASRFGWL